MKPTCRMPLYPTSRWFMNTTCTVSTWGTFSHTTLGGEDQWISAHKVVFSYPTIISPSSKCAVTLPEEGSKSTMPVAQWPFVKGDKPEAENKQNRIKESFTAQGD